MNRFLWASYGMYLLGGITSVFFGAIMPELVSHFHTTYTSGGFLILLQSIGFIIGVPLTASCMRIYHYRFILSVAALAVAIAQIGVFLAPSFSWIEALAIINGLGASSLETAVASYVMELYEGRRAIYMSRLEVAFGMGALCMPAIVSGLIAIHIWDYASLLVGGFALVLAIVWTTISVPLKPTLSEGDRDARTAEPPVFSGKVSKYGVLLMFLIMIFVYVGVEGSLNSFLPSLFTVYQKVQPSLSSLSTSVFWVAMVFGRLAIGWIVRHVSYERYLFGSIVLGIVFFLLLTLFRSPWISYAMVFGLGLAMSAVYSVTMVYANHTFPGMERMVTSAVTAFAGIGGAVFPAVVGYTIDHLLPQQVLWLVFGFVILLLLVFLLIYFSLMFLRKRHIEHAAS